MEQKSQSILNEFDEFRKDDQNCVILVNSIPCIGFVNISAE